MKKSLAFILVFVFTLQVSATSFAQSNSGAEVQAIQTCFSGLVEEALNFQKTQNLDLGDHFDRVTMLKGLLALTQKGPLALLPGDMTGSDNYSNYSSTTHDDDKPMNPRYSQHINGMLACSIGSSLSFAYAVYSLVEHDYYPTGKWYRFLLPSTTAGHFTRIAVGLTFGYLLGKWGEYLLDTSGRAFSQNNSEIDLDHADTELAIFTQLSSESDSVKKYRSQTLQTCQNLLNAKKFYEQNPKLLEQELLKSKL